MVTVKFKYLISCTFTSIKNGTKYFIGNTDFKKNL